MTSQQDAPSDSRALRSLVITIDLAGLLAGCQEPQAATGLSDISKPDRLPAEPACSRFVERGVGKVYFEYDSAELGPSARGELEDIGADLLRDTGCHVMIEGHCDERGTREYNIALGEKRANAVRQYLVALGIDPARMSVFSYGKERPAVTGHDEEAWAQNRRAVLVFESGS